MLPLCLQTHRLKIPGISRVSWKESVEMSGDFSKSLAIFGLLDPCFLFFFFINFFGNVARYKVKVPRVGEQDE